MQYFAILPVGFSRVNTSFTHFKFRVHAQSLIHKVLQLESSLYQAFIHSHRSYCCPSLWRNTHRSHLSHFVRLQKQASRLLTSTNYNQPPFFALKMEHRTSNFFLISWSILIKFAACVYLCANSIHFYCVKYSSSNTKYFLNLLGASFLSKLKELQNKFAYQNNLKLILIAVQLKLMLQTY